LTTTSSNPATTPFRLLMAAYQCGPGMGSVSQIGWEWFSRSAHRRPITLVTHERNRQAISREDPLPTSAEIIYIDTEWFAGPLFRLAKRIFPNSEHGVFLIASLDYFLFDFLALRTLRKKKAEKAWALIHQVTPVTLAAPSRLYRLGLPVVWGPLNCGLHSPPGFESLLQHERPWMIKLRDFPRLLDALWGSTRHTAVLLTATQATRAAVPLSAQDRCHFMLENGVDLTRFIATPWPTPPDFKTPLEILFVGRMITLKGVDMLLDAMAALVAQRVPVRLTLVGDGPQYQEWFNKAERLQLGSVVNFTGALPFDGVAQAMRRCHVFCLPSVRESGGAVLLEAMACARPVVAVAHGGPAEIVDDGVGASLAATDPQDVTRQLVQTFQDVISHPQHWQQRGQQGRNRVEAHYEWEQKITAAQAIYDQVLQPPLQQLQ
jgi:glycosyltransferase involved in cell wall biosynthesis